MQILVSWQKILEPVGHESCMGNGDMCPSTVGEVVVSLQDVRAAWSVVDVSVPALSLREMVVLL